jgi:hypothetical protein
MWMTFFFHTSPCELTGCSFHAVARVRDWVQHSLCLQEIRLSKEGEKFENYEDRQV